MRKVFKSRNLRSLIENKIIFLKRRLRLPKELIIGHL